MKGEKSGRRLSPKSLRIGRAWKIVHAAHEVYHGVVEVVEPLVFEQTVVDEAPLAACVFVAPSVAFAWEVNPFGVAPFIAHEVEVASVDA